MTIALAEGVEHGTPDGYAAGCREVTECPAYADHGMACFYAHLRAQTDPRYYRAKVRDPRPAAIAKALGFTGPKPDEPAPKVAPPSVEGAIVAYAARKEQQERDAAIARARPRREPIPSVCPECAAGKHTNCDGTSWCQFTDQPTTCSCTHDPENTPTPQEHTMAKKTEPTSTPATKPKPPTEGNGFEAFQKPQRPTSRGSGRSGQELAEIRFWARSNGHDVASHGRIPWRILDAYDEAIANGHIPTQAANTEAKLAAPVSEPGSESAPVGEVAATLDSVDAPPADEEPVGDYDYAKESDALDEIRERADIVPTLTISDLEAQMAASPLATEYLLEAKTPRPDWATVTVSQDVERARDLAVRLEAENAILLAEQATMGGALDFALRSWATADDRLAAERRHIEHLNKVRVGAVRYLLNRLRDVREQLLDADATIERNGAELGEADHRIAELTAEVERLRARRWWQLGGAR